MTARKRTTRKTRKKASRRRSTLSRLEAELPKTLRGYTREVQKRLNHLEREVERASVPYRRRAAKLIREASHHLGSLQARGESGWRRQAQPYRKKAQQMLRKLERAVAPPAKRKATRRKKAA